MPVFNSMAPSAHQYGPLPNFAYQLPTNESRNSDKRDPRHETVVIRDASELSGLQSAKRRQPKLLTVDEALQFSPFSSIVPFYSNIIPPPKAQKIDSATIFSSLPEQAILRQSLNVLDNELAQNQTSSELATQTVRKLQDFINNADVSEFKFKRPDGDNCIKIDQSCGCDGEQQSKRPSLGSFAKMFLNTTDFAHHYPSPTNSQVFSPVHKSPASRVISDQVSPKVEVNQQPLTPITPGLATSNQTYFAQNSNIVLNHGDSTGLDSKKPTPFVLIPPLSADLRQSDYVTFQEDHFPSTLLQRDESAAALIGGAVLTKDPRAIADHTSRTFQDMLQEIFEADEQAASASSEVDPCFVWISQGDNEVHALAPATLVKLDTCLQKVTALGKITNIPAKHLSRLQGLCENPFCTVQSSKLEFDFNPSEEGSSTWLQEAETAEIALHSARIAVRVMTAGRKEKELYSEELLQNVLGVLNKTLTSCIIPIAEARPKDGNSEMFNLALTYKKEIAQLLYQAKRVMKVLVNLLGTVEMAETIITALEFFAIRILFVENAQNEKDSALGIQKFETLRRTAMDLITEIFQRYPEQRPFIFDEILTSLQKLPTKGLNARQFKLTDGNSIQLVCALIMRLIQTSGTKSKDSFKKLAQRAQRTRESSKSEPDSSDTEQENASRRSADFEIILPLPADSDDETNGLMRQKLSKEANALNDSAAKDAQYVVRYFVQRAITASKGGDQPHRHLLDMFSEDLISVLGDPEWPAAELLLRALLVSMINITEGKSTAPAKNMALELLGMMGSAISGLVATTQHSISSLDNRESDFSGYLRQLLDEYLEGSLQNNELLRWNGPYRAVVQYLSSIDSDGLPTQSAQGYYLTQWARAVSSAQASSDPEDSALVSKLHAMLANPEIIITEELEPISKNQCRLAYALTILSMDFCRQFDLVFKILLDSITSEQPTVRTRSLKSVTQMLEKDPSLIDRARNVRGLLMRCSTDASPMVRDSTLMLIGKCILLKPTLEQDFFKQVLSLCNDPTTSVRKRSMKILKDMYLRNSRKEIKLIIAECLLQRIKDFDKVVSDIASQTFEEIWLSPFWKTPSGAEETIQEKLALKEHMNLIARIVQRGDNVVLTLVSLFQEMLSSKARSIELNFKVCSMLVSCAFESVIDPEARTEDLEQKHIVLALTVFARADARLFNPEQLQHLRPYAANLSTPDDFLLFRSVVIIFRCVLPVLSTVQQSLLREVQASLLQNVSKLGKIELNEVAACLWTINGTLRNPERLVKLIASVVKNLHLLEGNDISQLEEKNNLKRLKKYIQIAGYFGKHCQLEDHAVGFREALPWWKGSSVSGLIISSIKPFVESKHTVSLRSDALNSIGLMCQAWPHHFNQIDISNIFHEILGHAEPELQNIVLTSFKEFFAAQEYQAEGKNEPPRVDGPAIANGKLGGSMTASEGDGASALIAQRFLKIVLSIALASQDTSALTATEVIASINRQGLVHPKESGPALVALETSTNAVIARVAFAAHRDLHQQHESMFEREYIRAIQETYRYQSDVVGDPHGYTSQPHASKLQPMFEIIKTSKGKYQKKFISNFCSKIDFDIGKLILSGQPPYSLQYSRFLTENLAFFEYGRVDELLHTLACIEKIVADTGAAICHNINTEVFHVKVDTIVGPLNDIAKETNEATNTRMAPLNIEPRRMLQLTVASTILSCLWEARIYLRRLYGLSTNQRGKESKSRAAAKDINKAPTRMPGVTGDKFLAAIAERVNALNSSEGMLRQCQDFVELLSIDSELKVSADDEEDANRPETPSGDEEETPVPASGGSRGPLKRKSSASLAGTPHKKRGRPSLGCKKSGRKSMENDEDWE